MPATYSDFRVALPPQFAAAGAFPKNLALSPYTFEFLFVMLYVQETTRFSISLYPMPIVSLELGAVIDCSFSVSFSGILGHSFSPPSTQVALYIADPPFQHTIKDYSTWMEIPI